MKAIIYGVEWEFKVMYDEDCDPHWTDVLVEYGAVQYPPQVKMLSDYVLDDRDNIKRACFKEWKEANPQ